MNDDKCPDGTPRLLQLSRQIQGFRRWRERLQLFHRLPGRSRRSVRVSLRAKLRRSSGSKEVGIRNEGERKRETERERARERLREKSRTGEETVRQLPPEITRVYLDGPPSKNQPNPVKQSTRLSSNPNEKRRNPARVHQRLRKLFF